LKANGFDLFGGFYETLDGLKLREDAVMIRVPTRASQFTGTI
jgi:hypothetical protein